MINKIKILLLAGVCALSHICRAQAAQDGPDLTDFSLVFSDEFNGSTLDSSLWITTPLWGPYEIINNEQQYYVDPLNSNPDFPWTPFEVSAGVLTITASPTSDPSVPDAPDQPAQNDQYWIDNPDFHYSSEYNASEVEYLSGVISSLDSFNFTHGYAEIRAQIPKGQGLWPAFWQLTSKYVEDVPEIDIMENLGQNTNELYHTLHYFEIENNWNLVSTPSYKTTGPDYSQDFHTFGLMWEPKKLVWYVDGVAVKTLTEADGYLIPKQSMYLIANLAVGGNWAGPADATTPFPADYKIDHVRVFRKDMPTPINHAVLGNHYQLMFEDDFSGNVLNEEVWNTSYLWGPYFPINNEQQIYIDKHGRQSSYSGSPFSVSNGKLKITAQEVLPADLPDQEPADDTVWTENPSHQFNANYNQPAGWTPAYTSGVITSYDSFKFVHGYAEMRAKLPAGDGLWPAFWLLNGYYVGPQPEIDILEMKGEDPSTIHHSYHYYDSQGNLQSSSDIKTKSTGDYTSAFHTYGLEWNADYIKWYIDGKVTRTLESENVSTQLMYVIANLAVGGDFVGPVGSTFPKSFEIDYIRVYQLSNLPVNTPELSVDIMDNAEYGYYFNGQFTSDDEIEFTFSASGVDLQLDLTAYDIDVWNEVDVRVNGSSIGYLATGANFGLAPSSLSIPSSLLLEGGNSLVFDPKGIGWRWGITNILLTESSSRQLLVGETHTPEYGYGFNGQFAHYEPIQFTFSHSASELELSLTGFDIDSGNEVSVWVNGSLLGYLSKGPNNGLQSSTLPIPVTLLDADINVLEIRPRAPGWIWGVSNLLLSEPDGLVLTPGAVDSAEYGYAFNNQYGHNGPVEFNFVYSGTDLQLSVVGYDIDIATEVTVLVNGTIVGYLAKTANNAVAPTSLTIPASNLNSSQNTLEFRPKFAGWHWGITDILLFD